MQRFYPKVIGLYGLALAGMVMGLFYLFYSTGWVFSHSMSGLVLWILKILFAFLITFLAISRLRKAAGQVSFLMVVVHVLLISVVAALLGAGYNSYFYQQVAPDYEVRLYETAIAAKQYQLDYYEKQADTPPKLISDLKIQIKQARLNIEQARQRPHDYFSVLREEVVMYLFTGLINALVLGLFFGILLKEAPRDTSQGARILYRREGED